MTDLAHGLEKAIYDRLKLLITDIDVYQHVPENRAPPVIMIADMRRADASAKTSDVEEVEVEIVTVMRTAKRQDVHGVQARIKDALHRWKPADTLGTATHRLTQIDCSDQLMADGQHYYGNQRFRTWIEPA